MFQVFNMGTRLEIYTDEASAHAMIEIAKSFNIDAQVIGRVVNSDDASSVEVHHSGEVYTY